MPVWVWGQPQLVREIWRILSFTFMIWVTAFLSPCSCELTPVSGRMWDLHCWNPILVIIDRSHWKPFLCLAISSGPGITMAVGRCPAGRHLVWVKGHLCYWPKTGICPRRGRKRDGRFCSGHLPLCALPSSHLKTSNCLNPVQKLSPVFGWAQRLWIIFLKSRGTVWSVQYVTSIITYR